MMSKEERKPAPSDVCDGCGQEVDWSTCWCGGAIDGHGYAEGHSPVPMGCDCFREDKGWDFSGRSF